MKTHIKKQDKALIEINAIVNDLFAWRSGPNSLSVAIKEHIDTLADNGNSDAQIYAKTLAVFDLLYLHSKGNSSPSLATVEARILTELYGKDALAKLPPASLKALNQADLDAEQLKKHLTVTPQNKDAKSQLALTLSILKHKK